VARYCGPAAKVIGCRALPCPLPRGRGAPPRLRRPDPTGRGAGLPTDAITSAPERAASCTVRRPTPPDAPVTSTRRPMNGPRRRRACSAVTPATGRALAAPRSTEPGSTASSAVSAARSSAQAPRHPKVTTRVPAGGPAPLAAGVLTTPAASHPKTERGPGCEGLNASSPKFNATAPTSTKVSESRGTGSGTSPSRSPRDPSGSKSSARMLHLARGEADVHLPGVGAEQRLGRCIAFRARVFPGRAP
jgi:hypothetical protein